MKITFQTSTKLCSAPANDVVNFIFVSCHRAVCVVYFDLRLGAAPNVGRNLNFCVFCAKKLKMKKERNLLQNLEKGF